MPHRPDRHVSKAVVQVHSLNRLMKIDDPVNARKLFGTFIYSRIMTKPEIDLATGPVKKILCTTHHLNRDMDRLLCQFLSGYVEFKLSKVSCGAGHSPLCDSCYFNYTVERVFFYAGKWWKTLGCRLIAENCIKDTFCP